MRKMTLLEMVQNIASALETDEVNSITDTTESLQIAEVIKETYYEQFNNIFIPEMQKLLTLESVSNVNSPNYLKTPNDVSKILWLRYKDFRSAERFVEVEYVSPEDFLFQQLQFYNTGSTNLVKTVDISSNATYYIFNNVRPSCFTMFDDEYISFDSFDSDYETTMQGHNSIGYGIKSFEFLMKDAFVPNLDGNLFPLLLAEAKSTCFINLKQVSSSKEEQKARRQRIRMQNDQWKARKAQYAHWNRGNNFSRNR